jgi:hypothetical protein
MPVKPLRMAAAFRAGIEDVILFPLVMTALVAKGLSQAALSALIRILDFAFLLIMQLARPPLFIVRVLGDGAIAALQGFAACLPVANETRQKWREFIGDKWSRIRGAISYKVFEEAVHRVFERGMGWVFKKCRNLTPRTALYVLTGAILWLPISLGVATAIHALLLANAASLPAWMQLLHPFATIIAKSKLLVLPVYPAAWPQAKKHPFIRTIAAGYRNFEGLFLIQKMEHRYRQTEQAMERTADAMERLAALVGLSYVCKTLWSGLNGTAVRIAKAFRDAMSNTFERLSGAWLIGPVVSSYASDFKSVQQRHGKVSKKLSGVFERWSIKFSAEYYEAKEREKAAKAGVRKNAGRHPPSDPGVMSAARSGIMPPDVPR